MSFPSPYDRFEDTYLRPCVCAEEDKVDFPRSFCYAEGTDLDKSTADTVEELSENVWYESKPPCLFKGSIRPIIPARQIQITRVIMNGTTGRLLGTPEEDLPTKERIITKITKKRSAAHFLSTTKIDED